MFSRCRSSANEHCQKKGNAWATAGMLRVLATIKNSQYAQTLQKEVADLSMWAFEIQHAMYQHLVRVRPLVSGAD